MIDLFAMFIFLDNIHNNAKRRIVLNVGSIYVSRKQLVFSAQRSYQIAFSIMNSGSLTTFLIGITCQYRRDQTFTDIDI